jgi:hypothetical protein
MQKNIKKIFILFLIIFVFSCKKNNEKKDKKQTEKNKTETQSKLKIITKQKTETQKKELKLTETEKEIAEVAISFHKWHIRNTDGKHNDVPTDFNVRKGENGYCIVDFEPYFKELRKLGTISETFLNNEIERNKECVDSTEKLKWKEYDGIPENCDDYDFWTQSQDFEDGNIGFKSIKKEKENWKVLIYLFIDRNGKQSEWQNATANVKKENGKYMLTEIKWIEN